MFESTLDFNFSENDEKCTSLFLGAYADMAISRFILVYLTLEHCNDITTNPTCALAIHTHWSLLTVLFLLFSLPQL